MEYTTMTIPEAATLTEAELFQRYLDAPVRSGATSSTLIADGSNMMVTARERYDDTAGFSCDLLAQFEGDEHPAFELERQIEDLTGILEALTVLKKDFDHLIEVTRIEPPADDAPDAAFRDWKHNPRFILPTADTRAEFLDVLESVFDGFDRWNRLAKLAMQLMDDDAPIKSGNAGFHVAQLLGRKGPIVGLTYSTAAALLLHHLHLTVSD